ncbi:MAG: BREX system P-loop protein BrxC [bacterium]
MKNNELFTLNPSENNLINDGVVEINTAKDDQGLKILRHEIKTFVCEGEYQNGIYRILDTYLKHINQPKQPAAWVSGFFGSGKSHLVKILGYLWEDFVFPNGDTARTLKPLPTDIKDLMVELDRKQKLIGKLTVSGTLKDFPSADIRYSFLQLFLNALDLPPQYHHFKFVYWAKQEGVYDDLKTIIETQGKDFRKEYENLFVSSTLAKAVLQLKPEFAENEAKVKENFKANFKRVDNISRQELIDTIKNEVLPLTFGDKVPCTIIVLDEVQQFIGTDGNKTIDIQNLAQDICSNFDSKFLLVGTGQNALSETPFLQPLQDRFTIKVSLSDTDVETVTRKTVLEKKPSVVATINNKLESVLGEISRNLSGTEFGYVTSERNTLVADYPILPATRKFWKRILQSIDTAGTSGQLRSQLRIVDESIKHVAEKELGVVVPADFIFEQKQQQLLQNALLLNETNNIIQERKVKGGDSLLEGRILSVVFLIDQLPNDLPGGILKSDEVTIADLLIENLNESSDIIRNKVKELIKKMVDEKVLMLVNDEYKLQTKVGAEWEQEYTTHAVKVNNSGDDKIQQIRKDKINRFFKDKTKTINIQHGNSKQRREFEIWDKTEKPNLENKLNIWIRDGWFENEIVVLNEIRAEGADKPLAYTFVRKLRDTELRLEIIKYIAADLTIQAKGLPSTPEGEQAKKSMETRKEMANKTIEDIVEKICNDSIVYLAGGNKVEVGDTKANIDEALNNIADRQFPEFRSKGDYKDWDRALIKAIAGEPDALKKILWDKEPKDHPMAIEILRLIGNNNISGKEIRNYFTKSPYGWSQDAIDTIIIMLKNTEHISASEPLVNQSKIANVVFKKEIHTISASEKIKLRKLYQEIEIMCKPGEEFLHSNSLLDKLKGLAAGISGDAPKPEPINIQFIKEIENLDGNERLLRIIEEQADLKAKYFEWKNKLELINKREPQWILLNDLAKHASSLPDVDPLLDEIEAIKGNRLILMEPDPIQPKLLAIVDKLKARLNELKEKYITLYDLKMNDLQANEYFVKLHQTQKHSILAKHQLLKKPEIKALDANTLKNELLQVPMTGWETKIAALLSQFESAMEDSIKFSVPEAETFLLPRRTINTTEDIEIYIHEIKTKLDKLIKNGKSIILK